MAEKISNTPGIRLDLQQLQLEAQHRWLRPAEICEILRNFQKFHISPDPPNQPPSGSLFIFDRKVLRYFRKDGHNWRKKKDGKTVKEAHEKLKVGSVDVLHCYYAHGQDNECFQRRSYWLLEEEYMHIVFVHYLAVKGNRSSFREVGPLSSSSPVSNSLSSGVSTGYNEAFGSNAGSPSAASTLTSAYEDFESVQIQKKYRGWSMRREFLIIRERVDKIQVILAHSSGLEASQEAVTQYHTSRKCQDESIADIPVEELIEKADGLGGVFPEHKHEIVNKLQEKEARLWLGGHCSNEVIVLTRYINYFVQGITNYG